MHLVLSIAACVLDRDGDGHRVPMDCDDGVTAVHPGAPETCGNGVDDDCDGRAAGCGLAGWSSVVEADARVLLPTGASWRLGQVLGVGDADGDGFADVAVRADAAGTPMTAAWLIPGPLAGDRRLELGAAAFFVGGGGDALGAGDLDGDGLSELIVGWRGEDDGVVYVLPPGTDLAREDASAVLRADSDLRYPTLLVAGDTDGDGLGDLLIADPNAGFVAREAGAVWVVPGPVTGEAILDRTDALHGDAERHRAGDRLAAADLDGDGLVDVLAAAGDMVYVHQGPVGRGALGLSDATVCCGSEVAAGDVDGDGYGDVLVGSPWDTAGETAGAEVVGAAFLFRGPLSGEVGAVDAAATIHGQPGTYQAGRAVALPGDLDGDGRGEVVLLGSVGWSPAAFVFPGSVAGVVDTLDAGAVIHGEGPHGGPKQAVGAGDLDGDGFADLLLVDTRFEHEDTDEEVVHLFRGGPGL